jgi:hypothetical protein
MLRSIRNVLSAALFGAWLVALPARAIDYTDLWFVPAESGWGVNVVQSDNFMFLTFFIYGADSKPTWYSADLQWNGTAYTGGLYATQGTYYAVPWNTANNLSTQVGTATFQPDSLNAYQATLTYNVNGIGTVIKAIERQTLTTIALGGSYIGGQVGAYSNCTSSSNNGGYTDTYSLAVAQTTGGVATFTFGYTGANATCILSGQLEQHGQVYRIPGASYTCTGDLQFSANSTTMYEIKQTAQGIEGRFAASLPSGCQEDANFSAVFIQSQ